MTSFSASTGTNVLAGHLLTAHKITSDAKKLDRCQKSLVDMFKPSDGGKSPKIQGRNNVLRDDKYRLVRELVILCSLDFEAFSIVNRRGFKLFCQWHGINPESLPTRTSISETGLNDVYSVSLKYVKNLFKSKSMPQTLSLTMDCWTDNMKRRSFVNYCIQYCKDFQIYNYNLKTEIFEHPHTALRINDNINEMLEEFGLKTKKIIAVTDNGSNIVAGLQKANIPRVSCCMHNLHLFLTVDIMKPEELNVLPTLICKMKVICRALTYKTGKLERIHEIQESAKLLETFKLLCQLDEENEIDESTSPSFEHDISNDPFEMTTSFTSIKNSNATRWGSTLAMLNSFVANKSSINSCLVFLNRIELLIAENEFQIMVGLKEFLTIFHQATITLQGRKYPTLSLHILFYEQMMKK